MGNLGGKRIARSYGKIILSASIMGVVIYFLWKFLEGYAYNSLFYLIIIVIGIILIGAGLYILFTYLLRMEEIKSVLNIFRNLRKKQEK
jgi:uncharacterized protein YybS (DUF2232 family)